MKKNSIETLRKKLPTGYSSKIAAKLNGISSRKVIRVMNEQITDFEIVLPVLKEARKLAALHEKKMKRLQEILK